MFHPDGTTFAARVRPIAPSATDDDPVASLGERLAGHALARFSGALWRGDVEHFEVLGTNFGYHDAVNARALRRRCSPSSDRRIRHATPIGP